MEKTFNVGDIKKIISESSNEFKAKLGQSVESEDKKNNGKAYSDAKSRAKNYDGGLADEVGEKKPKYVKNDVNKTTLDYTPENVTDEYKKRVKAQVKGYSSELEMKNGSEKNGEFDDNENFYDGVKKSGEDIQQKEFELKKSGLQARELPDEYFKAQNMYESKEGYNMRQMLNAMKDIEQSNIAPMTEHVKTIVFKKTQFLTEQHMITKIPDDFKKEFTCFKMKDNAGNVYLVEWRNNKAKEYINNGL